MHLNLYTLVDPRHLEPGQIIDADDQGYLVVDELRRRNGAVVVYGYRRGSDSKRRVAVTYEVPGNDVAVIPADDVAAAVWASVVECVNEAANAWGKSEAERGGDIRPAPWATAGYQTLVVRRFDTEFWLDVAPPARPDEPPAD